MSVSTEFKSSFADMLDELSSLGTRVDELDDAGARSAVEGIVRDFATKTTPTKKGISPSAYMSRRSQDLVRDETFDAFAARGGERHVWPADLSLALQKKRGRGR